MSQRVLVHILAKFPYLCLRNLLSNDWHIIETAPGSLELQITH